MRKRVRRGAGVGLAVVALASAGACEVPPPPVLVVTTTAQGADAAPGDGVCEVNDGAGDCTLHAAIEEANSLGRAEIEVPTGSYYGTLPAITGNLGINRGGSELIEVSATIEVSAGGALWIEGVWGRSWANYAFRVDGTLVANRVSFATWFAPLVVNPTGRAVVQNAFFASLRAPTVANSGDLGLRNVDVFYSDLGTNPGGTTTIQSTSLVGCFGLPPVSEGRNLAADTSCELTGPTDVQGVDPLLVDHGEPGMAWRVPGPGSPLIDAVPVGTNGCGDPNLSTDLVGAPRPVDGDGDDVAACDIGPIERQP